MKDTAAIMSEKRTYTETYLLACDLIKDAAEDTLERPLTPQELAHIYNAGSLMMLELVAQGVDSASKETLSTTLLSAGFTDRLDEIRGNFPKVLAEAYLGQSLSQQLVDKIQQLPYVYSIFQVMLRMEQTPQQARYQQLTLVLDELLL